MSDSVQGNPDGLRVLAKYSKIPPDRIRYVANADEETVRSIERGVLFLMAFWSGSSITAFVKLTEVIARFDAALELVVLDVDGATKLPELRAFCGGMSGCGETAWVREGKIVATSGLGLNTECFEPFTLALLEMA